MDAKSEQSIVVGFHRDEAQDLIDILNRDEMQKWWHLTELRRLLMREMEKSIKL